MKILVTGGLGYIGSHTCVELAKENHELIIADNLSNSKEDVLDRLEKITGVRYKLYKYDLTDINKVEEIFNENKIDAVIHFAGLKAVGESTEKPVEYYSNNLISTLNLLEVMKKHNVKKIIFSSSATVYGSENPIPYVETSETGHTTNPYSTSKFMIELMLKDLYKSDNSWNVCILRYFNPIGAHESGLIGEAPNGIPNNLMPYILKVASGQLPCLSVFGNDYNTKDGTGVRDYIHVVDLAEGHVKALNKFDENGGIYIYNLGTGIGYSVLDIINNFEKANDVKVNYKIAPRRAGDIDMFYADSNKAKNELGWEAKRDIAQMCKDSWNWQKNCMKD